MAQRDHFFIGVVFIQGGQVHQLQRALRGRVQIGHGALQSQAGEICSPENVIIITTHAAWNCEVCHKEKETAL
jgi:hypothetical protein